MRVIIEKTAKKRRPLFPTISSRPSSPFVELLATSAFSFLRGGSHPESFIARAAELGYPALGLPDHLGFYGSARAHGAATAHGIRALVGASLPWADDQDKNEQYPAPNLKTPATPKRRSSPHDSKLSGEHSASEVSTISLLCPNQHSYQTLSRHLTDLHLAKGSQTQRYESQAPPPILAVGESSLLALTGHPGSPLYRYILQGEHTAAMAHLDSLLATFGRENIYLVLTRHLTRHDHLLTARLRELSQRYQLPLLASNAPIYATKRDKLIADVFTCLRHHTTLDQAGTQLGQNSERHLKSPSEMRALFPDQPEALAETLRLNDRLEFTLENLGYRFPSLHPEHRDDPDAAHQLLTELSLAGARNRYRQPSRQALSQLKQELALIRKLEFSGYFLIVHDLITFANSQGILCQGRGSAANSVVCYVLGLTAVDPIASGLLFERFLSENRKSWPDIDIDFPSGERRESVIQYVFQKYGSRGAAMTANVITYRPRSTFRELTKVLGLPEEIANRFSEIHASPRAADPAEEVPDDSLVEKVPHSQFITEAGVPESHPRHKPLAYLFDQLLSFPRHLGQHSGGIIICDSGLDAIVPIQPAAMPGRTIVQWDKDDCEDLGIVKIDLLGLGMLAAMEDTIRICQSRGKQIDLAKIPKDDEATFDLMCRGDTIGTFQVESRAQMNTLPILQPRTFYDVAIEVAIIRPGPIVGELAHPYLNRRQGFEKVDHIHPLFEPVLARTLGVPLFQEQVLRMAMLIADFTGSEADELRRAMAFKRSDEKMARVSAKLRHNMTAKGIAEEVQEKIIKSISSFALYGFPESHAISFALIAYASCWLKVHHPVEFYAGLINNQPMGFYNVNTLLQDAKRHGVRTRPVSVVHSAYATTVADEELPTSNEANFTGRNCALQAGGFSSLRLGLHRLKGITRSTSERILLEREKSPFTSLPNFLQRARPNKKERRLLAETGALNDLPNVEHRRDALWQVERRLQLELFTHLVSIEQPASKVDEGTRRPPPALAMMTPWERIASDLSTQNQSTGPHPLKLWRNEIKSSTFSIGSSSLDLPNLKIASQLSDLTHGSYLQIAGMVICRQRPQTAKGHCFISLEDESGIANIFVPKKTFEHHRLTITTEPFLLIEGMVQIGEGGVASVYTHNLWPLSHLPQTLEVSSHDFH